jgi:hypothetical protein
MTRAAAEITASLLAVKNMTFTFGRNWGISYACATQKFRPFLDPTEILA